MSKAISILKKSYVIFILAIFYIPVIFAAIFSFNKYDPNAKGAIDMTRWYGGSLNSYSTMFDYRRGDALLNSLILGVITSLIVAFITLITVYGLWRQRNKAFKTFVDGTSNIPLINPDVITAVSLSMIFGAMFGSLSLTSDGMWRAIIAHVTMILPFGILIAYPRSMKFQASLMEASKDLGYGSFVSWIKTYFRYMLPITVSVMVISMTLSFDDFILTRTVSNTSTIGTKLYESPIKGWALALGSIMMLLTISGSLLFVLIKTKRGKNA